MNTLDMHRTVAADLVRARDSYTEAVRQFASVSEELQRFAAGGRGPHYFANAATAGQKVEMTALKYRTLFETAEMLGLPETVLSHITDGGSVLDAWRMLADTTVTEV